MAHPITLAVVMVARGICVFPGNSIACPSRLRRRICNINKIVVTPITSKSNAGLRIEERPK